MTEALPPPPGTWAELADAVRAAPGMYVISMAALRDLEQSRRTDAAQPIIMQALKDRAIGFLPDPLPTRANATVILYMRGTAIGDFVWSVITASRGEPLTPGQAKALTDFGQTRPPDQGAMAQLERLAADDSSFRKLEQLFDDMRERERKVRKALDEIKGPSRRK